MSNELKNETRQVGNEHFGDAQKRVWQKALVYAVATSPNVKAADELINGVYTSIEQKFKFLEDNFNFQIACACGGTDEPIHEYYGLAIKFILSEARDWGVNSVIKNNE
jgi:hypothetical protein